jgi:hypothetical protein
MKKVEEENGWGKKQENYKHRTPFQRVGLVSLQVGSQFSSLILRGRVAVQWNITFEKAKGPKPSSQSRLAFSVVVTFSRPATDAQF